MMEGYGVSHGLYDDERYDDSHGLEDDGVILLGSMMVIEEIL